MAKLAAASTRMTEPRLGVPHRVPSGAAGSAAVELPAVTSLPADAQRGKSCPVSLQGLWHTGPLTLPVRSIT